MYRVAFSHVMLGLAGRHEQPSETTKDVPMTNTVLLIAFGTVNRRPRTLVPKVLSKCSSVISPKVPNS